MGRGVARRVAAAAWALMLVAGCAAGPSAPAVRPPVCAQVATAHVATAQALLAAVTAGCKVIVVDNEANIDLTQVDSDSPPSTTSAVVKLPEGVTLESGRSATVAGGLLFLSHDIGKNMLDLGNGDHITGLRLRGYDWNRTDTSPRDDETDGIRVNAVTGVTIDNNEIWGWPEAGVEIGPNVPTASGGVGDVQAHVTNNFIHGNIQCNAGYGVVVGYDTGNAVIDRNVFDDDRHDVAGGNTSPHLNYVAELNFVLTKGPTCGGHYNQHFDMHGSVDGGGHWNGGCAGNHIEIRDNTIRGDQKYGGNFLGGEQTRPAFELRGTPNDKAIFADNAVEHDSEGSAIKIVGVPPAACCPNVAPSANCPDPGPTVPFEGRMTLEIRGKLSVSGNHWGVNTSSQLAVGDFDGDGCSDVFQSVGTLWVYSPCGRREWRFLNQSTTELDRLAFGDFNGDGKTDVFTQDGDRWLVSYGGTSPWTPLPETSDIPMSQFRFGDFNGDGKTDVFRASGEQFFISSGGVSPWQPLLRSSYKVDDLRFGDFNGDGKTDVFSLADGQWSVSYGGSTNWQRLNMKLSTNLSELVFADFNGDGRTDIARSNSGTWQVSWGGATAWATLQGGSLPSLPGMLFGDFNGDKRADVLERGDEFRMSAGGTAPMVIWSTQPMD